MSTQNIILVGNPNTGKTTLFNTLTSSNNKTGNWHGLTNQSQTKTQTLLKNKQWVVTDLPGIYSLEAQSFEEQQAIDFLNKQNQNCTIINVIDSINLEKNLTLTKQLLSRFKNVIVLINEFKKFPLKTSLQTLSNLLNVPVFKANFSSKTQTKFVFADIFSLDFNNLNNILHEINIPQIMQTITTFTQTLSKTEKIFLKKWLSLPLFLGCLFGCFYITFGPVGSYLSSLLHNIFVDNLGSLIQEFLQNASAPPWITDLYQNGILLGISGVLSFLPQVVLLQTCFFIIEEFGLFSYLAFTLDGVLTKIGLSGKSVFSLLLSYGCNTTAVSTTRNLNTLALRKKTVFLIPYYSCSAKLPVLLSLSALLFEHNAHLFVFALYILGVVISILFACLLKVKESQIIYKTISKTPSSQTELLMEMPRLAFPSTKKILFATLNFFKDFALRFSLLIFSCSVFLWFLSSFSFSFEYVLGFSNQSMLYQICNFISPIFSPIGLSSVACVCAILTSIIAKELAFSSFVIASGFSASSALTLANINLSFESALSLLVFIFLCTPCIACIFNIKKELGTKTAVAVSVSSFIVAYVSSLIAFNIAKSAKFFAIFVCGICLFAFFAFVVLKYIKGSCKACTTCNPKCNKKQNNTA